MLARLRQHILPDGGLCEEAAFLYARAVPADDGLELQVLEVNLIPPEGFASRSRYYLELRDDTRAHVIKRAHDLGASLIECHSHPGQRGACFSWSDLHGFDEFVPHVMWRLKGRPYAAIVIAPDSFDALVWRGGGAPPEVLVQSMVHLTEKPVELARRAIEYSSRPGENVLDLFGGSGSTLIAAEMTGRRAYLMELDPLYCDVIVERWSKFAGRKAERASAKGAP